MPHQISADIINGLIIIDYDRDKQHSAQGALNQDIHNKIFPLISRDLLKIFSPFREFFFVLCICPEAAATG
jgi:hypothetical protein